MPRKQFLQDLEAASSAGIWPCLHGIRRGDDDESIRFSFSTADSPLTLDFQAAVSDLSEYPHSHQYLIYSTSATVPPAAVDVLDVVQAAVAGASVCDLLSTVSDALEKALSTGNHQAQPQDSTTQDNDEDEDVGATFSDFGDEMDWEEEFFDEDEQFFGTDYSGQGLSASLRPNLRAAKAAGFKVGYLGHLHGSIIVSVSCRISKLGISEEAMQAWDVQRSQYLVLMLRFPNGYLNTKQILELPSFSSSIQMHVGLCSSYKPSMAEATRVFTRGVRVSSSKSDPLPDSEDGGKLLPLFLEVPLNSLLNERFIPILRIRHRRSFTWSGAESFVNAGQGLMADSNDDQEVSSDYFREDDESSEAGPTRRYLLQNDHFLEHDDLDLLSFPLLAMQFTLRHFVKCPEFCLVCHCKIDANFEALKPYVCSQPLCLYQYMALGMGPNIEWAIRRQPLVIDLLVSFAYVSAATESMVDLPVGLKMMVPRVYDKKYLRDGSLSRPNMQLKVDASAETGRFLSPGDWLAIELHERLDSCHWHCRVESTDSWPVVDISEPVVQPQLGKNTTDNLKDFARVKYLIHDMNFDEIKKKEHKQKAILNLLRLIPDVFTMKEWLEAEPSGTRLLSSWEKIPPAAIDLLRWIVASNKSCIMLDGDSSKSGKAASSNNNLITGMDGYLQFRFAQGSPDKEEKFMAAFSKVNSQYPTIFAWHGSALSNWHGIIREGLHFKKVSHGRACGDGVYMAQDFGTSQSYAGYGGSDMIKWPNSILRINSALSLNEVVNENKKFVHNSGGVYVVNCIDWIQTRYLFVQCQANLKNLVLDEVAETATSPGAANTTQPRFYTQDPHYVARGYASKNIEIPLTLFSQSRRRVILQNAESKQVSNKKGKKRKESLVKGAAYAYEEEEEDNVSVATLAEDLEALFSDTCPEEGAPNKKIKKTPSSTSTKTKTKASKDARKTTEFEPGTLTESSITILQPPSYATSSATKALQQRLLQALKVQEKAADTLDELGWYIDPQLISNPYQWIVELHSFELAHPLGKDLKKAGIQSIILEMRFPPDFPMSPPFVRVIRPRLLEFGHGGGGHVTLGGALCMELLTSSGWLPTFSIENLLLSIRMAMCSMDPRPARLSPGQGSMGHDYSVQEAVSAYVRACNQHGWQVPANFSKMAW